MRMHLCALLVLATPSRVCAQEAAPAPAPQAAPAARRITVMLGSGNAMGWLGAQAERYFGHERGSVFLGLGYTPDVDDGETSGLAGAAGVRGYTGGARHRGFLELSVSQIAVTTLGGHQYGPGVQLGYQYTARHGFTVATSLGLGYVLSQPAFVTGSRVQLLGGLGLGYTWR